MTDKTTPDFTEAIGNANEINELLRRYGVKFGIYKNGEFREQFFPFDPIPRVIDAEQFADIEKGLIQRVDALNSFLYDIYHDKRIVRDGIIPEDFIYISSGYLAQCEGITPKNKIYSHISGIDLVQGKDGEWYILEDNLRIPSGASYPLIARELTRIASPDAFRKNNIVDNRNYADLLCETMEYVNCGGIRAMVEPPVEEKLMENVEVLRGPNIRPYPETSPLMSDIECTVSLKVGDNITTDPIMPAGAKILPLRSNIPAISQHCFAVCDEEFPGRAKKLGMSIIVGGSNYGQGSSREHAALAPLYLGIKAVVVKSFARIHRANLINAGILPLTFVNEADYDRISQGDEIVLESVRADIEAGKTELALTNKTTGKTIPVLCELTGRTKDIVLPGGLLDYTREKLATN